MNLPAEESRRIARALNSPYFTGAGTDPDRLLALADVRAELRAVNSMSELSFKSQKLLREAEASLKGGFAA